MEYGLGRADAWRRDESLEVLILLLMEYGLGQVASFVRGLATES